MPLLWSDICILLSRLEDVELRDPPFLHPAEKSAQIRLLAESWFKSHRRAINELGVEDAVAFISTLLPERRTDRVYDIQTARLCRILSRCLSLSASRAKELQSYKSSGNGDLAICVERILSTGGPPAMPCVGLTEVDGILQVLASHSRFSDRSIQALPPGSSEARDDLLGNVFKRLSPNEGKWMVRLILKDFSPVRMNETLVLKLFHFLLPDLLQFQNDFGAAIGLLKGPLQDYPEHPDPRSERLHRRSAGDSLRPAVGIKVGRSAFLKARSLDHCMNMLGRERWVLERKYDGEYCEIHIDLTRSTSPMDCISIFSKSGKNSTLDRQGIHQTLVDCLEIGTEACKFKRRAILLGELVAFSDSKRCILPFDEIRKHVSRCGTFIGTDVDSQPKSDEHLAIVFFDLLLLDNEVVMSKPIEERRTWLREVYTKIRGRAMGAEWKIVDFADTEGSKKALVSQFAASIAERCEGLVLKPCGLPYFALETGANERLHSYIKLKKDYIADLGDEADFAVIGASYNAQQGLRSGVPNVKWTDFHLGCLLNKCDVLRFDARPRYRVVGTINQEACVPRPILQAVNSLYQFCARPYQKGVQPATFDLEIDGIANMQTVFDTPFVFEVLGSGFQKASNSSFLMLRHPRVKKLHQDRSWKDCISFQELQEQAVASRGKPADSESQETRNWIEKLEKRCKKKFERQRTATPSSRSAVTPKTIGTMRSYGSSRKGNDVSTGKYRPTPTDKDASETSLSGTTAVAVSSRERKRLRDRDGDTPCPATKKPCTALTSYISNGKTASLPENANVCARALPLSDITNTTEHQRQTNGVAKSKRNEEAAAGIVQHLSDLFENSSSQPQRHSLSCKLRSEVLINQCSRSDCAFFDTAVYLSACIASTPYICHDLLHSHNATIIPTMEYWDRDCFTHPPLTEVVAESQSYEGMRKLVLVESKRDRAVESVVQEILRLNNGASRERIEVYDWRVLEDCALHDVGVESARKYLRGATMFDEERAKAVFAFKGVRC